MFEITDLCAQDFEMLGNEMVLDTDLLRRARELPGQIIIKAAGNMAYPVGLRTERLATEVQALARQSGQTFEHVAGLGADSRTMIGAGALHGVPVIVSAPQLVGGGMVGMCIGDSISVKRRCALMAQMLSEADVIIESGVALTQEIHDGPFETYTGHGIWARWDGTKTYSLSGKTLVRIDLDPNLEAAWLLERHGGSVQDSIDAGLPKTKTLNVPFRMEMSGFARLEGSIPLIADLGAVWPIIALRCAEQLGIKLDFLSYPQESEPGKAMRNWIVDSVHILDRSLMHQRLQEHGN